MMKNTLLTFFGFIFLALGAMPAFAAPAQQEGIAAVVNEDAITVSDLNDRLDLIIASSGLPNSPEIRNKLGQQIIGVLIEEQLKLQEAARLQIEVTPEEVNDGFKTVAQQNNIPPEKFREMLAQSGINVATMERQIKSQIGWTKIIQQELRPKVTITDSDVDNALERLTSAKGASEYLLAEIFLPVDDPKNEATARQLADKLVGEIKTNKTPFFKLAQQFSKAAGASQGGDLGWIQQGQLPQELDATLKTMHKEDVSTPIRSPSGYHILYVREMRQITDDTIPSRDQITSNLGIERLDRMQKRYLLDLKSAAFIENRVQS